MSHMNNEQGKLVSGERTHKSRFLSYLESKVIDEYGVASEQIALLNLALDHEGSEMELNAGKVPKYIRALTEPPPEPLSITDLQKLMIENRQLYELAIKEREVALRREEVAVRREEVAKNLTLFIPQVWVTFQHPHRIETAPYKMTMPRFKQLYMCLGCEFNERRIRSRSAAGRPIDGFIGTMIQPIRWCVNTPEDGYNSRVANALAALENLSLEEDGTRLYSIQLFPHQGDRGNVSSCVDTLLAYSDSKDEATNERWNRREWHTEQRDTLLTCIEYKTINSLTSATTLSPLSQGLAYASRYVATEKENPDASSTQGLLQLRVLVANLIMSPSDKTMAFEIARALVDFKRHGRHQITIDPEPQCMNLASFLEVATNEWEVDDTAHPEKRQRSQ